MKKIEESIEDLRAKVAEAIDGKKFKKASDLALNLANKLRILGQKEEAIKVFKTVDNLYEQADVITHKIVALKAIAELASELGERKECRSYLDRYEAEKRNTTDYQLMLTTGAYCMIKLYTYYEDDASLLTLARKYAEKSLHILTTKTLNPNEMLDGDTVKSRTMISHRMLSEIACFEHKRDEAEHHSKKAFELAKGMKDVKFEIARTRIDFKWRDKVETSMELCTLANSMSIEKKIDSTLCLSEAYFGREDIEKGIETLFSINESQMKKSTVDEDEREKYYQSLIFGYKARERIKELKNCTSMNDREGQYFQSDALADLYSDAGFNEAALKYYRMSLGLATKDQRINALSSCAETCAELKKFKEAAEYFDQFLEENDDISEAPYIKASAFKMRLLGNMLDYDGMKQEIETMEKTGNTFLNCVYCVAAQFCDKKGMKEEAESYRKKREKEICNKKYENRAERTRKDEIDELKDKEILNIMKEEKLAMAKQLGKKNRRGETKVARARSGTVKKVKKLMDMESPVGSKSERAKKRNQMKEREEDDLFDETDDEPLINLVSAGKRQQKDRSDDEMEEEEDDNTVNIGGRRRRSLDSNDPFVGLEEDGDSDSGDDDIIDGASLSQTLGSIDGSAKQKRRRNDSESSQRGMRSVKLERLDNSHREDLDSGESPIGRPKSHEDRRPIKNPSREQSSNGAASPVGNHRSVSRVSLTSSSATAFTFVQVVVVSEGMEPEKPILGKAPSDTEFVDLKKYIGRLSDVAECEWNFQGMAVEDSMTVGDLAMLYNQSKLELECGVKRTL